MATGPLTLSLEPTSELARALADAEGQVILVSEGVRFTVEREGIFARYEPAAALEGLRQSRGALAGVDTEALLADLADQREQGSIGCPA